MNEHLNKATTPSPEKVRREFARLCESDARAATRYLYELGLANGYIKGAAATKNITWTCASPYGELEISINVEKPEKDPRAIAAQESGKTVDAGENAGVPLCDLCWENEGFAGSPKHPAKPGLRIAAIELGSETWGLQYSPYAYFSEHCIALSKRHRPMKISAKTIERLFDFVDTFPFYFIGSNADLPIVGGSILGHDHFQGGLHVFPLMKAPIERYFVLSGMVDVEAGIVSWPASVIRLRSNERDRIVEVASRVLGAWKTFDDAPCGIRSFSGGLDGTRIFHNTLNPILHKDGDVYVMDLVLRNNRTTAEHPWGLFHPDETLHHIKKENIGLIEIMGLAILPPRLARELPAVQAVLHEMVDETDARAFAALRQNSETAPHALWAAEVLQRRRDDFRCGSDVCGIDAVMREEVTRVFVQVLEATGVFKRDAAGIRGWDRFVAGLAR